VIDLREQTRDGWGSHAHALINAFLSTDGPVLEFGAGHFSTPLLHSLCAVARRPLLTLESDEAWLAPFANLMTEGHELRLMPEWDSWRPVLAERPWSLVFVDHSSDGDRLAVVEAARASAVVVLHDSQRPKFRKLHNRHHRTEPVIDAPAGMPSTTVFRP
jgi:hypothetical protein